LTSRLEVSYRSLGGFVGSFLVSRCLSLHSYRSLGGFVGSFLVSRCLGCVVSFSCFFRSLVSIRCVRIEVLANSLACFLISYRSLGGFVGSFLVSRCLSYRSLGGIVGSFLVNRCRGC
jgi:hypothetical protein